MATDYIPATNSGFDTWFNNFQTVIAAAPADFGLVVGDATAITASYNAWHPLYVAAQNPDTRTTPAIAAMNAQRALSLTLVRPYAVSISQNTAVTDDNKALAGVTIRKTTPTPIPPPTTVPALSLVAAQHLTTQLAYRDTSTPTSKAKPFGAIGIEVWSSVGEVFATDPAQASYVATWTKSPNVLNFEAGQVGKKVTVWGRWVTRGGAGGVAQTGPWSTPLNFTVL